MAAWPAGGLRDEKQEVMGPAQRPVEIDVDRSRELRIVWADGHRSVYPLPALRRACPCAACRSEREQRGAGGLPVVRSAATQAEMATVEEVALVGQYAVQIRWKDGHATGIYEFAYLRELDPTAPPAGGAANSAG